MMKRYYRLAVYETHVIVHRDECLHKTKPRAFPERGSDECCVDFYPKGAFRSGIEYRVDILPETTAQQWHLRVFTPLTEIVGTMVGEGSMPGLIEVVTPEGAENLLDGRYNGEFAERVKK